MDKTKVKRIDPQLPRNTSTSKRTANTAHVWNHTLLRSDCAPCTLSFRWAGQNNQFRMESGRVDLLTCTKNWFYEIIRVCRLAFNSIDRNFSCISMREFQFVVIPKSRFLFKNEKRNYWNLQPHGRHFHYTAVTTDSNEDVRKTLIN